MLRVTNRSLRMRRHVPLWQRAKSSWPNSASASSLPFSFAVSSTTNTSQTWAATPTPTPTPSASGKKYSSYPDEETENFFNPRLRGHTSTPINIASRRSWIKSLGHVPANTAATNADFNRFVLNSFHKGGASYRVNEIIKTTSSPTSPTRQISPALDSNPIDDSSDSDSEKMKIRAVIGDLAGTFVNPFSTDPATAFKASFEEAGYFITLAEARGPTGVDKGAHQKALFQRLVTRNFMTEEQRDDPKFHAQMMILYQKHQLQVSKSTTIIPGADLVIKKLQRDGILVGATTGYYSPVASVVLKKIWQDNGVALDACVSADELPPGKSRPYGDGIMKCLGRMGFILSRSLVSETNINKHFNVSNPSTLSVDELNSLKEFSKESDLNQCKRIYNNTTGFRFDDIKLINPRQVIKTDDTVVGILEGRDAHVWTVAICGTSVLMEIDSVEHYNSLSNTQVIHRLYNSCIQLEKSRPDYILRSIAELPLAREAINQRLALDDDASFPASLPSIRLFNI